MIAKCHLNTGMDTKPQSYGNTRATLFTHYPIVWTFGLLLLTCNIRSVCVAFRCTVDKLDRSAYLPTMQRYVPYCLRHWGPNSGGHYFNQRYPTSIPCRFFLLRWCVLQALQQDSQICWTPDAVPLNLLHFYYRLYRYNPSSSNNPPTHNPHSPYCTQVHTYHCEWSFWHVFIPC